MFILCDLEYTSWPCSIGQNWSGKNEHREINLIGAYKVNNLMTLFQTHIFNGLVNPKVNLGISEYLDNLTEISQRDVYRASDLKRASHEFLDFVEDYPLYSWGGDISLITEYISLYNIDISLNTYSYDIRTEIGRSGVITSLVRTSGETFRCSYN